MSEVSVGFICRCGKVKTWVYEGEWTTPCPQCGRKYFGVYSYKKLTIIPRRYPTWSKLRAAASATREAK